MSASACGSNIPWLPLLLLPPGLGVFASTGLSYPSLFDSTLLSSSIAAAWLRTPPSSPHSLGRAALPRRTRRKRNDSISAFDTRVDYTARRASHRNCCTIADRPPLRLRTTQAPASKSLHSVDRGRIHQALPHRILCGQTSLPQRSSCGSSCDVPKQW